MTGERLQLGFISEGVIRPSVKPVRNQYVFMKLSLHTLTVFQTPAVSSGLGVLQNHTHLLVVVILTVSGLVFKLIPGLRHHGKSADHDS